MGRERVERVLYGPLPFCVCAMRFLCLRVWVVWGGGCEGRDMVSVKSCARNMSKGWVKALYVGVKGGGGKSYVAFWGAERAGEGVRQVGREGMCYCVGMCRVWG